MVEGERLYGDGVNIAARVESLAAPGGICISGRVYEHVENKLVLTYEYLGEQTVKNIAKPVRVWRIRGEESEREKSKVNGQKAPVERQKERRGSIAKRVGGVAGVALIVGGIGTVLYLSRPPLSPRDSAPITQEAQALPLPDKPSIVVLPFVNMSEDPKQDYFSDGITEDLTTALSQIASLFVIAHNSAFTYKGKAVKIQDVGKELGVQYVLEGSVRKANDQVRITAQLVEAATDSHLWAERYDRPLKDIFALQDEIVQKIVTTLKLQLTLREQGYLVRKTTDTLEAYDYFLRGLEAFNRATQEANAQARQLFEKAIELDPQYAEAYVGLSRTLSGEWIMLWNQDPQTLEREFVVAQRAVALDDSLPVAHIVLSYAYLWKKQHEQAIASVKRAIALGPNEAEGTALLGFILNCVGQPEEAIGLIQKAIRLNPRYPYNFINWLGLAYVLTRRYEEAIATLQSATLRNPNFPPPHLHLLVSYSELGRDVEARAELAELLRVIPNDSLEGARRVLPFKDPADLERYLVALRKAGLK